MRCPLVLAATLLASAGCHTILGIGDPALVDGGGGGDDGGGSNACTGDQMQDCFTGPAAMRGVGACKLGTQTCSDGTFGACTGEGAPSIETCSTATATADPDCDGVQGCHGGSLPAFTTAGGDSYIGYVGTDAAGNVYAFGGYTMGFMVGSTPIDALGSGDMFLMKQRPDGTVAWAKPIAKESNLQLPEAMHVAADGTITIAALYGGHPTVITLPLPNPQELDYQLFVASYTTDGDPTWVSTLTADPELINADRTAIARDGNGNIYVATRSHMPGPTFTAPDNSIAAIDPGLVLVLELDPAGFLVAELAMSLANTNVTVDVKGLAVSRDGGSLYVGLEARSTGATTTLGGKALPIGGSVAIFTATRTTVPPMTTIALDRITALTATDGQNTVNVGAPAGLAIAADRQAYVVGSDGSSDDVGYFTEIDNTGHLAFMRRSNHWHLSAVAVDAAANITVAGQCTAAALFDAPSFDHGTIDGNDGMCIGKYGPLPADLATYLWNNPTTYPDVTVAALAPLPNGGVVAAGSYTAPANFGAGALATAGGFLFPFRP